MKRFAFVVVLLAGLLGAPAGVMHVSLGSAVAAPVGMAQLSPEKAILAGTTISPQLAKLLSESRDDVLSLGHPLRLAGRPPAPRPKQPAGPFVIPSTGDLIEISIATQRLTAWRDGKVVMRVLVSTGRPGYATPKGHFRIKWKSTNVWSTKWKVWMPYSMNFYQGYFIHQLPHYPGSSVNIGASRLGHADSHGCVRVGMGDAERLYKWTAIGTPVWVH